MRLSSLSLQNFRQHAESEIAFGEGVTAIVGSNGAGKSTLLEAIGFALFGAEALRGTVDSVRWNRAPAKHPVRVSLFFVVDGTTYLVQRDGRDASLTTVGAVPVAEGTTSVNAAVRDLLGMSFKEFAATFLCQQKDLARLAGMGGTERETFMRSVLGVSKLDAAVKAARAAKNDLQRERDGVATGLGERTPLETELADAGTALANARGAVQQGQAALGRVELAHTEAEAELDAAAGQKAQHDLLTRQRQEAEAALVRNANEVARIQGEMQRAEDEVKRAEAAEDALLSAGATTETLADARRALSDLVAQRATTRAEAQAHLSTSGKELSRVQSRIERLESLGENAECPTCGQPFGESFGDALEGLRDEAESLVESVRLSQEVSARFAVPTEEEAEIGRQIARLEAEDRQAAANRAVAESLPRLRGQVNLAQVALSAAATSAEVLTEQRDEMVSALATLAFDAARHVFLEDRVVQARRAVEDARLALARAQAQIAPAAARVQRAKKALEDYDGRAARLRDLTDSLTVETAAALHLDEFRSAQVASIRPELEELVSGFVYVLTDGRFEAATLTPDFAVTLHRGGTGMEVISGGEEDVAALAMRLAVSQMVAERAGHPLSLLVLDEPFGSQDETRRGNVMALLRRLSGVFEQVVIISHVGEIQHAADHAVVLEYDEAAGCARAHSLATT